MATISYKRYHDGGAVHDVNHYITDGHGDAAPERTNRYISDGHGGTTICKAYNCPDDPDAATAYMDTLRLQYELNHADRALVQGKSKQRRDIVHLQFFLSFAEYEDVPESEMMEITDELLQESGLDQYACRVSPHVNTWRPDDKKNPGNKHVHISMCPYALDGTHKLSMTHTQLWELQKKLDRLCVAHGYSIIATPILLADPEHRAWFEEVAKAGEVTIHPHQPESKKKRTSKSMDRNQESLDRDVKQKMKRSEIRAYNLMRRLDIRSPEELNRHIQSVGSDICDLRREMAHQTNVIDSMEPQMAAIRRLEGTDTPLPKGASQSLRIASTPAVEKVKLKHRRAKDRLASCESKLESRKKEYGQLKRALNVLGPELWQAIATDTGRTYEAHTEDEEHNRKSYEETEARIEADRQRLLAEQSEENRRNWYVNPHYVSSRTREPYRVRRTYPGEWQPLSTLELVIMLAMVVIGKEGDLWTPDTPPPGKEYEVYFGRPDYKIQRMMDSLEISREEEVFTLDEINDRIASVGYQIGKCGSEDERKELKERYRNLHRLKDAYYLANNAQYCYGPDYPAPAKETEKSEPVKAERPSFDAIFADAASRAGKPKTNQNKNREYEK